MRPRDAHRWPWLLVLVLLGWATVGRPAAAAPEPTGSPSASPGPAAVADADAALNRALEQERRRDWAAAIRTYEEALEQWPDRVDLRHRLRLCEAHHRLVRRYQDRSFREVLLPLSGTEAARLYDEILDRIEAHYVEPVALADLVRHGYDNVEVALRDPAFLDVNAPGADMERIRWLRGALQARRGALAVSSRATARSEVLAACEQARLAAGIPASAILLEFAYGACDSLDDYSSYLTPDRLDDLYAMIDGNFVGLGVELKSDDAGLMLVGVLKGGPAHEAKLVPGDRITHVDGQSMRGLDLDAAANRLQGPEGSTVTITLLHADGRSESLTLTRRPVEVLSVAEAKIVDPVGGVGYVQLIGFQKSSTEELRAALASLSTQGMRYLVLDLRGNPGGLLNIAVEMADLFLDDGVIVSTRGRASGQSIVYRARNNQAYRMPMAILIDHDSASASEILAGALQDHGRATVLGERSYGKGLVQSIFPLQAAPAGLKLTTAKFYSPSNRSYSEQGVEPNTVVTVRARPAGDAPTPVPPSFGDPAADPVLRAAIQGARRQLYARNAG